MSQARALLLDVILGIRVDFVIAQAPEDAGVGAQARQLPQTCIQRIAPGGDQIAGDQRQMRARLVGHIDGARQLAFAQKRAEMDVGQLNQAQAVEILGQVGKHQILFPQRKIEGAG